MIPTQGQAARINAGCVVITARQGFDFAQDVVLPLRKAGYALQKTARIMAAQVDGWFLLQRPLPLSRNHLMGVDSVRLHLSRNAVKRATTGTMRSTAERKAARRHRRWAREEVALMQGLQRMGDEPADVPMAGFLPPPPEPQIDWDEVARRSNRAPVRQSPDGIFMSAITVHNPAYGALDPLAAQLLRQAGFDVPAQARRISLRPQSSAAHQAAWTGLPGDPSAISRKTGPATGTPQLALPNAVTGIGLKINAPPPGDGLSVSLDLS